MCSEIKKILGSKLEKAWADRLKLYAEAKRFEIDPVKEYPRATRLRAQGDMQFAHAVAMHCGPDVYITWHSPLSCTVLNCTAVGAMVFLPDEMTT